MKVLFAAGDIGGARSLIPIMALCERKSLPFMVFDNGPIVIESPEHWNKFLCYSELDINAIADLYRKNNIGVLVFASSVKDSTALFLAREAKKRGIPVVHVLDNWTGYRERLEMDGLSTFIPNVYTVIDDLAFDGAVVDDIDGSILQITGQPALASVLQEYNLWRQEKGFLKEREYFGFNPKKILIAFVSEPAEKDQGSSLSFPQYRGYTEKIVLQLLCEALMPCKDQITVGIMPHPREDLSKILKIWDKYRGPLDGGLLRLAKPREGIFLADGIAGMASILLYEAWLLGKPVISLQPGLRVESLRMLEKRQGVTFVDQYENFSDHVSSWVPTLELGGQINLRPEVAVHANAAINICEIIETFLKARNRKVSGDNLS